MPTLPSASLKLEAEIESRLLRLAETRQQSTDLLVREAIKQYVEREECRERLQNDARAAGRSIKRPGRTSTGDEADAWLSRLEAGEDVEPPSSHT